ncbi:MAG: hypothetical protein CO129_04640 [Ignavibacteriales bacterium CG_4_9_14_3_um_filter_34_10]|nr:MAG: hypothetical protein CO129_04640 [Ignavibacteriales bacterium CG_4_9_14_3_um_filter_34_10]
MELKNKELLIRFIKFGIVGGSGIVVNSAVLWLCHDVLGLIIPIASIFSVGLSILTNFLLNDFWTWKNSDEKTHNFLQRMMRYYISASFGAAINYVVLIVLTEFFGIFYLISNLIGILGGTISNFLFSELWVFKAKKNPER